MKKLVVLFSALILSSQAYAEHVPTDANAIRPILIGAEWPEMTLKDHHGAEFDVREAFAEKPAVVIVYRGGWCPYCNTHLGQLQEAQDTLNKMGYQVLAISPDRPAKLAEAAEKQGVSYQLLSDSDMAGSRALGIAFKVPDELVSKYKNEYGIDIEADSGHTHHQLPVPAVFIVDTEGVVQFAYVNPNYRVRLAPEVLVAAAKAAVAEEN